MYERFVFIVFIHEYCNVIMMACHSIVKTGRNRFRCYHYKCFVILLPIVLSSVIFLVYGKHIFGKDHESMERCTKQIAFYLRGYTE